MMSNLFFYFYMKSIDFFCGCWGWGIWCCCICCVCCVEGVVKGFCDCLLEVGNEFDCGREIWVVIWIEFFCCWLGILFCMIWGWCFWLIVGEFNLDSYLSFFFVVRFVINF